MQLKKHIKFCFLLYSLEKQDSIFLNYKCFIRGATEFYNATSDFRPVFSFHNLHASLW